MITLAVYETFTAAEKRAKMGDVIRRRERKELGGSTLQETDPLGNVMVDSTQQLSGKKRVKKKRKPKKPQSLSKGKPEQKRLKIGSGKQPKMKILQGIHERKSTPPPGKKPGRPEKGQTEKHNNNRSTSPKSSTPAKSPDRRKRRRA